jgi:hypothetical protein
MNQATSGAIANIPAWAKVAASAVPLCVLPSAAWRFQHGAGVLLDGPGQCGVQGTGEAVYVIGLSCVSMTVALLTLGLVRPWGEVLPRWVPILGGAVVPRRLGTLAALGLAALIAGLSVYFFANSVFDLVESRPLPPGCSQPGLDVLVFYIPLLAWAPLLLVLALHYNHRRRKAPTGLVKDMPDTPAAASRREVVA